MIKTKKKLDTVKSLSYTASLACAIHCIITPFLVLCAPFLGHVFHSPMIELGLLLFSMTCGLVIIYLGYCSHKKGHSIILFSMGATLWSAHAIADHYYDIGSGSSYLVIGTSFVIVSYILNHRHLKCCDGCEK
jgi:hypothetical protein